MKLKTTTDKGRAGSPLPAVREQAEVRRRARSDAPYQRGIALVVTLILISVIGFMAITFLVLSQRERGAVSVAASQTDTRLAAETALQTAIAKLLAPVIAYTNPFNYDLLVSTNYINPAGFFPGNIFPTNVNYDYVNGGGLLTAAEQQQNIANLQYDPRPPVFVVTNKLTGGVDFRYYLDLNRNHAADPSGFLPETNNLNQPTGNTNYFVGDPEWIGILERPELPHSANNKFIARYAYIAVPVSKTLDLNYIHNQAKNPTKPSLDTFGGDFLRNQGVGSWEINLAAFLYDLNTNSYGWGGNYTYDPLASGAVSGNAFINAESLYRYRLNGVTGNAYNTLANVNNLFNGTAGPTLFGQDMIDEYTDGLLQTGVAVAGENDNSANPWPGADNPNHFFTTQDLFDASKTSVDFTDRLSQVGTNNSSYDRYTFTRLLSQLGTDSSAESGKLNLNYLNVDTNTGVVVPNAETNFVSWTPLQFFTNVASRLLANMASQPEFSREFGTNSVRITSIMVWPTNDYTPAVHRTLQLAANLYDATTNHTFLGNNLYAPSVFRPVFTNAGNSIRIIDYKEVTDTNILSATMRDLNNTNDMKAVWNTNDMVYGIPLVIGAKKGFPNFNSLALQTAVRATRKLQAYRLTATNTPNEIRQMYYLGVSNTIAVTAWNSYSNAYLGGVQILGAADVITIFTNEVPSNNGVIPTTYGTGLASNRYSIGYVTNIAAGKWLGFDANKPTLSFRIPLTNIFMSLTNSTWRSAAISPWLGYFMPSNNVFNQVGLTPPHWWMSVSTRLRFIIVDTSVTPNRILDYVNLSTDAPVFDITQGLMQGTDCNVSPGADASDGGVWCTNKPANYPPMTGANIPTYGILNQLSISRGSLDVPDTRWDKITLTNDRPAFNLFMGGRGSTNLFMQAPFTAFRNIYQYVSWQANDPLVHYMIQDLTDAFGTGKTMEWDKPTTSPLKPIGTLAPVNARYRPWGGNPYKADPENPASSDTTPSTDYHLELKDPLVKKSDSWDFPANKLPNIGWIGRVHRGTPWQTVYMKSPGVDATTWEKWTGNLNNNDAALMQPQRDWQLFDLFTTAPNANATRGQLPVNQTNLAAWSAALSGVIVLPDVNTATVIQPAAVSPELQTIVNGINSWRTNGNFNGIDGSFTNLGGVLAVPELTIASPYLSSTNLTDNTVTNINDAVLERIPQQIMSLLRLGDQQRFVIYTYGQSLKPADHSIVQGGTYTGMCTNYQITGETAVRTVVRIEGAGVKDSKPYRPKVVVESYNTLPPD